MADEEDKNVYGYNPSIAVGVIFIVIFGATTGYHVYQAVRARALFFIPVLIRGACRSLDTFWSLTDCLVQIFGYLFRVLSHANTSSVPLYALQTVLILLAAALYAASVYMVLGRLITHLNAGKLSVIRVNWMTKIFVTGDVISFLMQCAGQLFNPVYD